MKHDLHLMYKFTDRRGNLVYEKYLDSDRIERKNPLGEVRLADEKVGDEFKPACNVQGGGTG